MTDTSFPLVSVLIRSTGRPELLQALHSVAAQNHPVIEVIVADASGQNRIVPPVNFRFTVQLIGTGQPLQRSAAANLLLTAARGQFCIFLDDDDWFEPEHIARLAHTLQEHSDCVAAYAGVSCVEADVSAAGGYREVRRFDEPFDATRLMVENFLPIHAVMFRTSLINAANGPRFDPVFDLFEDWDFWLQCSQFGRFEHMPGVSAVYRIHGQSGAGVRVDSAQLADEALDQLLVKWQPRWATSQLHTLVGATRQLYPMSKQNAALQIEVAQLKSSLLRQEQGYEQALTDAEQLRQQQEKGYEQALANAEQLRQQQEAGYENSLSWRLTKPLRRGLNLVRRARGAFQTTQVAMCRSLLTGGTRLYRIPLLQPLWRLIPVSVKQWFRNGLLLGSYARERETSPRLDVIRVLGDKPLVSIVIPVYNHASYIEQCIQSALAQTWENLEVIVVNDASPDPRVRTILDSLQDQPRLTILHHEQNQGICHAQNTALIASTGEVIAFLDCDDYLAPDAIALCMQSWQADTVYLHSGRVNVGDEGQEINRINFLSLPRQDYFAENLRAMYATHLKLIRRDAFVRVGLFDPRFDAAQDYEMLMRIAFHYPSSSFVHVPDFVYFHRLHGQQTTETQRSKQDHLTTVIQQEACLRESIRGGQYGRFISFIMLSYGKHTQTLAAIESLKATVKIPHEIILHDNGSAPETVAFLRENIAGKFADVHVSYGERNLGPAQGRRVALEKARGEWVIVFDNDEIAEPGWLEELLVRAEAYPDVGAVCCRVTFPDGKLQFSGGKVEPGVGENVIDLALYDRAQPFTDLASCVFREVAWCPIGATLFTRNIAAYLHDGYPNIFEDAGVSFALKKEGLRLLNAPGALVWHEHISFQPKAEMREQYLRDRYNPSLMLKSVASFYQENGLLIYDEYVWRENGLIGLSREKLIAKLEQALTMDTRF